ncbi:MAG: TolC family protein [Bacteroidales bacterium]|nr:TolC family protein [Bacteroidales bacterium]
MKKWLTWILLLFGIPTLCLAQSLEEVIRLAQDSVITAFQSQYEYEYYQERHEQFEALRKPQLDLSVVPNYMRMISDLSRDYIYQRNYDRFSTAADIKLTQKVLGWGGEAYVGTRAIWSEYLGQDVLHGRTRDYVVAPVIVGYQQPLLGYNVYRWEKAVEDERLEAARKQHAYELHLIAEEATRRFFRLACAQEFLDMCARNKQTADTLYAIAREKASIAMVSLAELRSLELERLNAANALLNARNEEQLARESLQAYLRLDEDSRLLDSRLTVPVQTKMLPLSEEDALRMARANSPALQQKQVALTEARHQQEKARREAGVKVGVDLNVGMQQFGSAVGIERYNPQFYMMGGVTFSVPLMDHGAARKGFSAASAWKAREEQALKEEERALDEDVRTTLENLRSLQQMLTHTSEAVSMADDVFQLTADNYANGLCDIDAYSLAQNRRDQAYNQHLTALANYWITYYHLLTLTQYE